MTNADQEVLQRLAVEVMRLRHSIKRFRIASERLMATLEMSMQL